MFFGLTEIARWFGPEGDAVGVDRPNVQQCLKIMTPRYQGLRR
jgi:hypothetical protein